MMGTELKKTTMNLTADVYWRAKRVVVELRLRGGLSQLIETALEAELARLAQEPVSFAIAWRQAYGYREHSRHEWIACYGGTVPSDNPQAYGDGSKFFTLSELYNHWTHGLWNERTARLVREQRKIWKDRGFTVYRQPLFPPGWQEEVEEEPMVEFVDAPADPDAPPQEDVE